MEVAQHSLFEEFNLGRRASHKLVLREWSPSKRNYLEQCPRRYYYQYYAHPGEILNGDKATLQFYRKLSNSWMLAGILLHLKIKEVFAIWRRGEQVDPHLYTREIAQRWQRVRESSIQFIRAPSYAKTSPGVLLMEFVFSNPTANKMWWDAGQRLQSALLGFLTLEKLELFRNGGLTADAAIEQSVRVEGQGFRMRGKIDLAWRNEERVKVVDWKSGGRDGADSDLQLLAYALGVQHQFKCEISDLDIFRVELGSANVVSLEINEQEANRAKVRMAQDTQLMIDLHSYGERRVIEAFTPTGSPKTCRLCPFQRICPGSEV